MTDWFDARASRAARLSRDQRRKVRQIRDALGQSDGAVKDHFISLDTFERSAKKTKSGRVSGEWTKTLDKLHAELIRAQDRLDRLHTGLTAQRLLRDSVASMAAAVEAWRDALRSQDPGEIGRLTDRMRRHFAAAETAGRRGTTYLAQGR
jgi:hypothetical protein